MAQSREIEKLQRRWQENPLGLTFAPLAEAYRKEGEYGEALGLLEIGLAQHPGYVPAHIVRGRCYLDMTSDAEAEASFRRVADLDPENVIALKALAEIAERAGRFADAVDLLERLIVSDRSNEEATAQLERVRDRVAPAPPVEEPWPAEPQAVEEPAQAPITSTEYSTPVPELPSEEPAAIEDDPVSGIVEPVETIASQFAPSEIGPLEPLLGEPPAPAEASDWEDLEPMESISVVEAEVAAVVSDDSDGLEIESFEPVDLDQQAEVAHEDGPSADATDAIGDESVEDDGELEGADEGPPLLVTESMAELFLKQGHHQLALAVYAQLAARDPENDRVRGAIDRLTAEAGASSSRLPSFAAAVTGGRSIGTFFDQLLAAGPPDGIGEAPASTLGAVFDEGESRTEPITTAAEAGPSFDEFFGDDHPGGAPRASVEPEEQPGSGATDDIEEFSSWLRGLKR